MEAKEAEAHECDAGPTFPLSEPSHVNDLVRSTESDTRLERRSKIQALEDEMRKHPPVEIEALHYFADGLYAREIFIPKGTLLTGKIHKREHLNFISLGDISVVTEHGVRRIKAPCTMVSLPGTKRVGYAHEDTIWTTVHASLETDLEKLELELIAESFDETDDDDIKKLRESLKQEALPCPG